MAQNAQSLPTNRNGDSAATKIALADAITKWAELEDALALLLAGALKTEEILGPLIYFAPAATEVRFTIVDAVLSVQLKADPKLWQFIPIWQRLLDKLQKARRVRNLLADGAVVVISPNSDGIGTIRLTGPTFHPGSRAKPKQLPGMSLHDVRKAYITFWSCVTGVSHLSSALISVNYGRATPASLHQIALELEAHLKSGLTQIPDPIPPTFEAPF